MVCTKPSFLWVSEQKKLRNKGNKIQVFQTVYTLFLTHGGKLEMCWFREGKTEKVEEKESKDLIYSNGTVYYIV